MFVYLVYAYISFPLSFRLLVTAATITGNETKRGRSLFHRNKHQSMENKDVQVCRPSGGGKLNCCLPVPTQYASLGMRGSVRVGLRPFDRKSRLIELMVVINEQSSVLFSRSILRKNALKILRACTEPRSFD